MLQTIINYYQGESRHGLWGAIIGGLLLTGSLLLWKWAGPNSLVKGLSLPLLLFGLLVGIGGATDSYLTHNAEPQKVAFYLKDAVGFLKQEKVKTEKTHRGWRSLKLFWAVLGSTGLLVFLLIRTPFWTGAGLGTLVLAVAVSVFEFYSMQFNEHYYYAIRSATGVTGNIPLSFGATQGKVTDKRTVSATVQPKSKHETVPIPDNLNATAVNFMDSANVSGTFISMPDTLTAVAPAGEPETLNHKRKNKKMLDYYHSDLIRAKGVGTKRCLFSKKYISE